MSRTASTFPFSSLPEAVQAKIAEFSRSKRGYREPCSLLTAGRCGRDAVLGGLTRITFIGDRKAYSTDAEDPIRSMGPLARLLHRACTQAPVGLSVQIHARLPTAQLSELIHLGIASGGWDRVHHLGICGVLPAQWTVASTFPELHTLDVWDADIADRSLLVSANTWHALRSLSIGDVMVQQGAVPAIAAALASLPSLKDMTLHEGPPATLVAQVTGLVSLHSYFDGNGQGFREAMDTAARNPGLKELTVEDYRGGAASPPAPVLRHMLQSCTTLTSLYLRHSTINQQGLDVLLQHGTCITTLAVASFDLSASRSGKACSWESLEMKMGTLDGPFLKQIAYLPLRNLHTISLPEDAEDEEHPADSLHFPVVLLSKVTRAEQRNLLRAAAVDLAASKVWQDRPATSMTLVGSRGDNSCLGEVVCALAPLGGNHIKALAITGSDRDRHRTEIQLNKADVEALVTSLGSAMTSIYLDHCKLSSDVWPALARRLPAVTELSLGERVTGMSSWQLGMWAREMGHPVTIILTYSSPGLCKCGTTYGSWMYKEHCSCMQEVLEVLRDFGVHVTIKHAGEEDWCDRPFRVPASQWVTE